MHLYVYVFDMNDFNFNDKSKTDKQEIAQFLCSLTLNDFLICAMEG